MLPQDGFSAVGAGVASLGLTAVAAFVWFLMKQGAFGVKTLYPGDHAVRTLFGRPVRYHKSPKSLVFIAIVVVYAWAMSRFERQDAQAASAASAEGAQPSEHRRG